MNREKAKKIRMLAVDIDGVLTDGTVLLADSGDEYRAFNVHDGLGFVLWNLAGLKSAIITAKSPRAYLARARQLKVNAVFKNVPKKTDALKKILKKYSLEASQVCYIGDDLLDLAVLKAVGFSATVPEAPEIVRRAADYVTAKSAGKGAVREVIELLLNAQGKWEMIAGYFYE